MNEVFISLNDIGCARQSAAQRAQDIQSHAGSRIVRPDSIPISVSLSQIEQQDLYHQGDTE